MSRPLAKRRSLLEHPWPWLVLALLGTVMTALPVLAIDAGLLAEYEHFPAIVRGYTLTGLFFGVSCVGLGLLAFLYSLRKRSLQERMPVGTMAGWLWGHVYLGLLSVVLALAHAGYGSIGFEPSLGKLLLLLLLLLVVSGLVWRVIYGVVPRKAASEVGHYSQASSQAKAAALQIEIEKLAAGRSPALRQFVGWLLHASPGDPEVAGAARSLPSDEQGLVDELVRLARGRRDTLERERRQARYRWWLQGFRVVHVPVSLAFLLVLPLHVLWALDLPAKLLPTGTVLGSTLGGFHASGACSGCHERIVNEWRTSMHAHALTSPIMVAQTNQAIRGTLASTSSPDPQQMCVACHAPLATALAQSSQLPFKPSGAWADAALYSEGVTCAVCHQWQGEPSTGGAGLSAFQQGLVPGKTFFGPIDDPVGNAFHRSQGSVLFKEPSQLCRNCHAVQYDRNGDGKLERGTDLVLQTLFDEWQDFKDQGGQAGCVDCHMPAVQGSRAAESAHIPLEQDTEAPPRSLRSHSFVGVDYPIDKPIERDASRPAREALLRRAALLSLDEATLSEREGKVSFSLNVKNTGTGHNLPGGFAFVRQMWLEVSLLDAQGRPLAGSGLLAQATDDLCDASILDDKASSVREFVVGCSATDQQLTNFQQMLVDKIELERDSSGAVRLDLRGEARLARAPGSKEAVVQFLTGGPVPRTRAATGQPTPPLIVGEERALAYTLLLPRGASAASVRARLLFRPVPPYFLRALAKNQQPGDGPSLLDWVGNIEVTEMARVEAVIPRRN